MRLYIIYKWMWLATMTINLFFGVNFSFIAFRQQWNNNNRNETKKKYRHNKKQVTKVEKKTVNFKVFDSLITLSMVPVWCLRMACPHTDRIRAHCRLNYHNVYFVAVANVCLAALCQQFERPNVIYPAMLCLDAVLMVFATLFGERVTSWLVRSTWSFASL